MFRPILTKTRLIIELVLICTLSASAGTEVRFNRDVRPILSDNCFACHGPDEKQRKAKLRLDIREEALKPAESGDTAIVPGRPEQSELMRRIESSDREEVMPPPKSHKQLSALQKELLKRWIAEGAQYEAHWAFTPVVRPALPTVKDMAWPRNAIDYFILNRLEQAQLAPAPPASPEALLRRASFGVTGLPPVPEAVAEFAATHSDADYTAMLERLLASTQYGEHWARHWMDLTRYADSAGYELDYLFTHAWRYRDWLVRSFAANKPMDRFIQEQIAGDELWSGVEDAEDGSLFLTIGPMRHEGGIQRTKDRENEWLTDVADTTGSTFLGLTMGCARCHDHKFDPLTQSDYYGLQAIFADSELKQDRAGKEAKETSPAFIRAVLREQAGVVQLLRRGEVDLPLREAVAALPAVLPGGGPLPAEKNRRAALARWLTEADNPLTARVLVNRVWQWHFGHGLVRTASDFGRQGEAPSHPELLDWLASELIASGWDLRHLQRLVLESATYRQSSLRPAEARSIDPEDRLLAGFPRQRLQAEELRDALLSVSGALNAKSFGPPVVPPMEPWALAALRNKNWEPTKDESEWPRRSLYYVVRRSMKLPFFDAFNSPDNVSSCAGRDNTVVASQALTLLNSEDTLLHARTLAGRLWTQTRGDASKATSLAWQLVFGRPIIDVESQRAVAFLQAREAEWTKAPPANAALPTGISLDAPVPAAQGAAWVEWCLALLNTNEFVYVD
ncbi:MAG: hypothetical protein QOE70_3277 [Chthoniobacter sp.]|jgi:cytochrome c553|nr:hypothetical protein [Chthoniobacter sp.]